MSSDRSATLREPDPRLMFHAISMKPTVLMIGEAKCGTSAVFEHLVGQGRFCPPPRKELHYFDRTCSSARNHDPNFVLQAKEYHQCLTAQCAGHCGHRYTIDATPAYLRTPGVERLVREMVYDPRIVVLLRNPATRLYSNYWMHRRRGRLAGQSFDTFATEYIQRDLHRTAPITFDYATNLARWFRTFTDQRRFFIGFHESLVRSPDTFMASLADFPEIPLSLTRPPVIIPGAPPGALPMQHYPPIPASAANRLDEYFAPFDDALAQLLNRDLPWRGTS